MIRARESRPGGATQAASTSVVATHYQDTETPDVSHLTPAPVDGGSIMRHGPAEPLDDCPDCHGAVQRWARHSEGLGELWEVPLSINTMDQPMSPRLPGPGMLSLAMDTARQGVRR